MMKWKETKIWHALDSKTNDEADKVKAFLLGDFCMDKIETILNKAGTTPKDFTLHDADHSFRVAERMWQIIPQATQQILSEYELALLLLSAYLHDIGMSPEVEMIDNLYTYLTTNDKNSISEEEKKNLQKWLDEKEEKIDVDKVILENKEKISEILTFYGRDRHNEWSEKWIKNNFPNESLVHYSNWRGDIINICKSHHEGLEELKDEKYDPIRVHSRIVHKRYIAMCLRLADVMEIDPERAPEVLIKHRNVIEGSLAHWLKEKFTSVEIEKGICMITARPPKAFIQKAIEDVADQIEQETNLCHMLKGDRPLQNIAPTNNLKHEWPIIPTIHKSIRPIDNSYEYIDGTFRPNSKKLLQLLAGTELYGNPLLAVRELLQNSLDAIKEQIGYIVLKNDIKTEQEIDKIREKLLVELAIESTEDECWIRCIDNGVGMDKETIKKCFLIGGASKRHELLELERNCNRIGFNIERTGQFGIGVLSFFMIADKLIVKTKKSNEAGYESNGWEFEINGLSDFGELKKINKIESGTEILLRIRKDLLNDDFLNNIIYLIETSLIKLPCYFNLKSENKLILNLNPGWCKNSQTFKRELINQLRKKTTPEIKTSEDFISTDLKDFIETVTTRKNEVEGIMEKSTEFIFKEGRLPNNEGTFRIHIPYFNNKMGTSFGFFFEYYEGKTLHLKRINKGFVYYPDLARINLSWKGISTSFKSIGRKDLNFRNCFIEVDLTDDSSYQISVSRMQLVFRKSFEHLFSFLDNEIKTLILQIQSKLIDNYYSLFNYTKCNFVQLSPKQYWLLKPSFEEDMIKIEKIKLPLVCDLSTDVTKPSSEVYKGKKFYRYYSIPDCSGTYHSIDKMRFPFDKAVFVQYYNYRMSFLKLTPLQEINQLAFIGNTAHFPPEWQKLFCFRGYHQGDIVLNKDCPFINLINSEDYQSMDIFFEHKLSLKSDEGIKILRNKTKSIAFLLYLIVKNEKSYWDGLVKNNSEFLEELWRSVFGNVEYAIYVFNDEISNTYLTEICVDSWTKITELKNIQKLLSIPGGEWKIDRVEQKTSKQSNRIPNRTRVRRKRR